MTQNNAVSTNFLTVAEIAASMRVSKMTVYRLVHSGALESVRFGRSYRVPERALPFVLRSGSSLAGTEQSGLRVPNGSHGQQ